MRNIIKNLSKTKGFESLLPIQNKFLEWWENEDRKNNLIVSAPTTSGKTLVAEALIDFNMKVEDASMEFIVVYISPLKALLDEKRKEFNKSLEKIIVEVGQTRVVVKGRKLILVTPEMFFECIKTDPNFLQFLSLVIIDEVHLISDKNRGLILDFLLTFLKKVCPGTTFLLMSATISYSTELMKWMNADLIVDETRAVDLVTRVQSLNKRNKGDEIVKLILKEVKNKKSILVFRGTKPWVHSTVKKLFEVYVSRVSEDYLCDKLNYGSKTKSDLAVENYLKSGIGLHHADIRNELKTIIENAFREQKISILVSTTTLGMGVNLPADIAIISDLQLGTTPLSLMNFYQMAGRAGRLGYSEEGVAYLLVTDRNDEEKWNKKLVLPFESDDPINYNMLFTDNLVTINNTIESNSKFEIYLLRIVGTRFFEDWEQIIEHHTASFSQYYQEEKSEHLTPLNGKEVYPGLHGRIKTEDQFISDIRKFGKILEESKIIMKKEILDLSIIGDTCLKNSISPIVIMVLITRLRQQKIEKLDFADLLIETSYLFEDIYVTPDPDNRTQYISATINGFKQFNKDVYDYLPVNYKIRNRVTTDLTSAAMVLSAFYYSDFNEVCDSFGILYQSFINAKNKLTKIFESMSIILGDYYKESDKAAFTKRCALQTHYCVSDDKISLVSIPGIGKARAESLYEKYKQIQSLKLTNEELIKELSSIKGISKKIAEEVLEVILAENRLNANLKKIFELKNLFDQLFQEKFVTELCSIGVEDIKENLKPPGKNDKTQIFASYLSLNKLLVENIKKSSLKNILFQKGVAKKEFDGLGSLKLFEKFLFSVLNLSDSSNIITPLFVLYDLRILAGHLHDKTTFKKDYENCKKRLNQRLDISDINFYKVVIDSLIAMYSDLAERIKSSSI